MSGVVYWECFVVKVDKFWCVLNKKSILCVFFFLVGVDVWYDFFLKDINFLCCYGGDIIFDYLVFDLW